MEIFKDGNVVSDCKMNSLDSIWLWYLAMQQLDQSMTFTLWEIHREISISSGRLSPFFSPYNCSLWDPYKTTNPFQTFMIKMPICLKDRDYIGHFWLLARIHPQCNPMGFPTPLHIREYAYKFDHELYYKTYIFPNLPWFKHKEVSCELSALLKAHSRLRSRCDHTSARVRIPISQRSAGK